MAQLQVARQEYDAGVRSAQDVLKYDPNNAAAKLIESAAMMGQKKFGDSRQVLDQMLKANPSSPDVTFQLGVVDLAEKKYKDAEASFRRAYELNPANTRGLMGVIETYMAQNMVDKAVQLLQADLFELGIFAHLSSFPAGGRRARHGSRANGNKKPRRLGRGVLWRSSQFSRSRPRGK